MEVSPFYWKKIAVSAQFIAIIPKIFLAENPEKHF
jgi:hypothetical protein